MTDFPKVIINADDFGYSEGVNQGIIRAYTQGVLSSTTVLANLVKVGDLLKITNLSQASKSPLGIGIHLNLTFGKPSLPELWNHQNFVRPKKGSGIQIEWQNSTWEEYFSTIDENRIEKEFQTQITIIHDVIGNIDHIDSHHSAASFGSARNAYLSVAKELNIPARPFAKLSQKGTYGGDFIPDINFPLTQRKNGIKTVDSVDMSYYYQQVNPIEAFCSSLARISRGEVKEFMFHPAVDASEGEWRIKDLEILTSPKTQNAITNLGIQLTTYSESAY